MGTIRCPVCGGACWDNRATKRSSRQPDYKCKDRECSGAIWPPRNGDAASSARTGDVGRADAPSVLSSRAELTHSQHGGTQASGTTLATGQGRGPAAGESLAACYLESLNFVLTRVKRKYDAAGVPMEGSTVAAVTATVFIQRCGRGR